MQAAPVHYLHITATNVSGYAGFSSQGAPMKQSICQREALVRQEALFWAWPCSQSGNARRWRFITKLGSLRPRKYSQPSDPPWRHTCWITSAALRKPSKSFFTSVFLSCPAGSLACCNADRALRCAQVQVCCLGKMRRVIKGRKGKSTC